MTGFPAWRYGPGGEAEIFQSEADVPAGWEDHPSKCACAMKPADVAEAVAGMAASIARFDHDGDGRPGGSKPRRKKAVKRDPGI